MNDIIHASFFENSPVPSFVIDKHHIVTHFNVACAKTLGVPADQVIGKKGLGQVFYGKERPVMADLIVDGVMPAAIQDLYQDRYHASRMVPGSYEAEGFFPKLGASGRWLFFTAAPLTDAQGNIIGAIETLQDITERKVAQDALLIAQLETEQVVAQRTAELAQVNEALRRDMARRERAEQTLLEKNAELQALNAKLSSAQAYLMQSEKLASIGQLAAGVAHEINNPIGYIFSNFGTLEKYLADLFRMLETYEKAETAYTDASIRQQLLGMRQNLDLEFLKEDIPNLMRESKEGIVQVRKIVQDLKDFSHVDASPDWQYANINKGIDSTLNVVNNEVKYKADIVKNYGDLPEVQCVPSQINQVVMNLVVNAAHAIGPERGTITLCTRVQGAHIWLEVSDTGSGIAPGVLPRIFDPFYTTKPVGKGTGLGLSLSYGIVKKHHGEIQVESELGRGTTFRVKLPLRQPVALPDANTGQAQA